MSDVHRRCMRHSAATRLVSELALAGEQVTYCGVYNAVVRHLVAVVFAFVVVAIIGADEAHLYSWLGCSSSPFSVNRFEAFDQAHEPSHYL